MTRTFAAAIFALLTVTTPAHAAYVDTLDAEIYFNGTWALDGPGDSVGELTGNIDFTYNPCYPNYCRGGFANPYSLNGTTLSFNGVPLSGPIIGNTSSYPGTQDEFAIPGGLLSLQINTADIGNLNFRDFIGATSGTVTVLSETCSGGPCSVSAVPLPPTLPLFGTALTGLGGFGRLKRRGKVSRTRRG